MKLLLYSVFIFGILCILASMVSVGPVSHTPTCWWRSDDQLWRFPESCIGSGTKVPVSSDENLPYIDVLLSNKIFALSFVPKEDII